ncbi:MAG: FhaA domain-containing protein [Thermomicrobiales bacterium]
MNVLDRFEHTVERLMEGSIARIFRSQVQPAEIGRKLERAMVEKQIVSVGTTLAPNDYRVSLHPRDLDAFKQFLPSLSRQMETHVTDVATRRGFTLVDRARVEVVGDEGVSRRAIRVVANIADRAPRPILEEGGAQRTEVFRGVRARSAAGQVRLRITSGPRLGQEVEIRTGVTTIGRSLDNDLVLDVGDVSRNHARLEATDGQVKLIDLESTNGTRVNGSPIRSHNIQPGDTVTIGTVTVEVLAPSRGH